MPGNGEDSEIDEDLHEGAFSELLGSLLQECAFIPCESEDGTVHFAIPSEARLLPDALQSAISSDDALHANLFGRKIVITRAAEQAAEFTQLLADAGAEVISFPTIQIAPPKTWQSADRAIREIARYDWLLFTSVNGVAMFFARLKARGGDMYIAKKGHGEITTPSQDRSKTKDGAAEKTDSKRFGRKRG